MAEAIDVAVIVVAYNACGDLNACLTSVFRSPDPGIVKHVIVVDNASTDGSAELVRSRFPQATLLVCDTNRGFAGGNNAGWEFVRQRLPRVRYVVLLNQDALVAEDWLPPTIECLERHPQAAAVQSKLLLYPETSRINSLGNRSHYLGFGYVTRFGELDSPSPAGPVEIDFASGAAVVLRRSLLEDVGLFDDRLFMYLEDMDLCWKLRQLGYAVYLVPDSVVFHKYAPTAPVRNYYYLERNRWLLLLTYYRLATLVLLLPALAFMEAGQWVFALRHRLLAQRGRVYAYFLSGRALLHLARRRRTAQARRRLSDRAFARRFAGAIHLPGMDSKLLTWVANPILSLWWHVVRRVMFW
jgi:GT2 family glycosyltransferase